MTQADGVTITVVVENWVDMLLADQASPQSDGDPGADHCVTRYGLIEHFDHRLLPPQAENGISMLVEVHRGRHTRRILFDVGLTGTVLRHNLSVFGIDPKTLDHVVISHGHPDHFGGIHGLLELVDRPLPVATHADAFLPRYAVMGDGRSSAVYNARFMPEQLERSGAAPVLTAEPLDLGLGVFTTGQIPRETSFEAPSPPVVIGAPGLYQVDHDGGWRRDDVLDEMGLVIDVKDVGLVVLTGCAHAGVINTLRQARVVCGNKPIRAVMGGFHLGFPTTPNENVALTTDALAELEVATVMPMHCSGLRAHTAFSRDLAAHYVQPSVGTVLRFGTSR
jgi:7,8-dihydropterin-6-yl-methyl-4-(beta-D-ribofuranosyl)aminobenzene 5'-phosphate synthase